MSITTQYTALTTIRAFIIDLGTGLGLLVQHVSDLKRGVSSSREAMQLNDLSDAELNELGISSNKAVEYTFRDEI